MAELWLPGAAEPSLEGFVERVLGRILYFTGLHGSDRTHVEVELADGARFALRSLAAEPGFGFLTLSVHSGEDDEEPQELIVPIGSIRRITLGPAEAERARFGFALPDTRAR